MADCSSLPCREEAQAAAKTNVTAKSQAAADVKSNSVKSKMQLRKILELKVS